MSPGSERAKSLRRAADLIHANRPAAAAEVLSRHLARQGSDADAHLLLAEALGKQGDWPRACAHAAEAVRLEPTNHLAQGVLGTHLLRSGRTNKATAAFGRAARLAPGNADAWRRLGGALLEAGRSGAAVAAFEKAVGLEPEAMEPRAQLANAHQRAGNFATAVRHFEAALARAPEQLGLHIALADAHRLNRDPGSAVRVLSAAVKRLGDSPRLEELLGYLHVVLGEMAAAERHYRAALALSPGNAEALFGLCRLRSEAADPALAREIESALADPTLAEPGRTTLLFARGHLLDRSGRHGEAMACYQEGCRLKRRSVSYDARAQARLTARLTAAFAAKAAAGQANRSPLADEPIFIVGMPRSATTLAEQMLGNHPEVAALGELPFIDNLVRDWPDMPGGGRRYPEDIAAVTTGELRALGRSYLDKVRALAGEATRTVDKMPANFQHLGLIARILPRARIVHCRREAMDVCLSNFVTLFSGSSVPFSYDFDELAHYYKLYDELMAHWRASLDLRLFDLHYEELIANPEDVARRLLEFCGLPWTDRVLAFHESRRPVMTASSAQVRRRLYATAVDKWRRYGAAVAPLKSALEKARGAAL